MDDFKTIYLASPSDARIRDLYTVIKTRWPSVESIHPHTIGECTNIFRSVDAGVFVPFSDGMFWSEAYSQAVELLELGKPAYELYKGEISEIVLGLQRKLSDSETRDRLSAI